MHVASPPSRSAARILAAAGGVCLLVAAALVSASALAAKPKRHVVAMTWYAAQANVSHSQTGQQVDTFRAYGRPFGRSTATTITPGRDRDRDFKHPKFEIEPKTGGWVKGELAVEKTYLRTTATSQKARYEGSGSITDGSSRSKYFDAKGRITRFSGVVTCYSSGRCSGSITVRGWAEY